MPAIECPFPDCTYVTDDVDAAIAAVLLTIHNNTHTNPGQTTTPADTRQKAPIDRLIAPLSPKDLPKRTGMPSLPDGTCSKEVRD